jgi:hypothetical protein
MRKIVAVVLVVVACSCAKPAAAGERPSPALEDVARRTLDEAGASGFIHVRDVRSGHVLAHVTTAHGSQPLLVDSPIRPLSVIKVFVAALWLESGFADTGVACRRPMGQLLVEDVIVSGCDSAGAAMAIRLRRQLGAAKMLAELHRYGLTRLTLQTDTSDEAWGTALTLGEDESTTPEEISSFFRAIATEGGGLFSSKTAKALRSALQGVVQRGTATAIKDSLAKIGWHIGGKTGTGPGECGGHCDGWFASIAGDSAGEWYVVLVFIRGKGFGGGVAARIAATIARHLAQMTTQESNDQLQFRNQLFGTLPIAFYT